jgi:acyl dehydratase
MPGLWFDDFREGQVFDHTVRRTVTEADNTWFSCLTMNTQPLHIDHEAAKASEFGRPLVNSLFTLGLMIGISVGDTTAGTLVGNLGMTDVVFPHPVFHGDTIRVRTTVTGLRDSRSRPTQGLATFLHQAFTQDGVEVARCTRTALMHRRPAAGVMA